MNLAEDTLDHGIDGEQLIDVAEDYAQNAREALADWDDTIRHTVRQHPFLTLAGALFGGYLVGRIVSRF